VQYAEVCRVADPVDELAQQRAGEAFQRIVSQVGRAELERGDAESVAAFRGQVCHETGGLELREQVIRRRAREVQFARDHGRGHRPRPGGERAKDAQTASQRRHFAALTHPDLLIRRAW
jgi:hypothetical protein